MIKMRSNKRFRLAGISLKTQLILSFLAVTLLVLSISSYYSYEKTLDILKKRTQETTLTQFRQIETNTLTMLNEVENLSKTFQQESNVQTFMQSAQLTNLDFILLEQEIMKLITQYLTNYSYLDSIYIFTDNGMVIGGTQSQNQSSTVIGKEYPFYSMPLYQKVKGSFQQTIWSGGIQTSDFMRIPIAESSKNAHLISALRGVTWNENSKTTAELVFNVNEQYLNSSYSSLQSSPEGSISIIDGDRDGKVFSSTIANSIGSPYIFQKNIIPQSQFGSFSANRANIQEQVIFYRMKQTGWILINEVPSKLFTKDIVAIQRFFAGIFMFSLVLIVVFSSLWMNRIMKSFQQLIKGMKNLGRGQIGLTLPMASNNEIGQLIEQFNHMSTGILELVNKNEENEKEKRQLEISALQSQINPHFLYNTLNTVKWMAAVAKAPNIMECMTSLGNMLRPIYYDPSPLWSIKAEIEFVKNYVNIMNFRYGEEITFEFDVPEQLLNCQTIRFMIQPSIENALIHGNMNKGVIQVSASELEGDLLIKVLDTSGGMTQSRVDEVNRSIQSAPNGDQTLKGVGLYNVNKRIQLHFGERYGIELKCKEGIETIVFMKIPLISNSPVVQKT